MPLPPTLMPRSPSHIPCSPPSAILDLPPRHDSRHTVSFLTFPNLLTTSTHHLILTARSPSPRLSAGWHDPVLLNLLPLDLSRCAGCTLPTRMPLRLPPRLARGGAIPGRDQGSPPPVGALRVGRSGAIPPLLSHSPLFPHCLLCRKLHCLDIIFIFYYRFPPRPQPSKPRPSPYQSITLPSNPLILSSRTPPPRPPNTLLPLPLRPWQTRLRRRSHPAIALCSRASRATTTRTRATMTTMTTTPIKLYTTMTSKTKKSTSLSPRPRSAIATLCA
ncbi:hypothetical protein BCR44DRAFT_326704 [Catenaria anguillulae PL171]|uniref:Uncharacterized protein n=1 Tax=Catenaria anguillulae PL171 TaxID=765915 RepID=A0A1Y2H701_9FUNG|nr:hypothetical protein BCR44DRAFT_326704 [Catenaria anguillulae PL171]